MTAQTQPEAMLPCPFCGGKALLDEDTGWKAVECEKCGMHGGVALEAGDAITEWNRRAPLDSRQECKPLDTRPVISDDELAKAFAGTNFGDEQHRQRLHVAVLKKASGYHCGHTITTIMRELRLIDASGLPTKKGRKLISLAFHELMVGGP